MDLNQIKADAGQTWKWLADGWRSLSDKAVNALTYFTPGRNEPAQADEIRWGLLAADVSESGEHVTIELEAPGLEKDEIDVSVDERQVTITGQKRVESERREGSMVIRERAFGRFQRTIPTPVAVTAEGAEASYRRGVLRIRVPKLASPGGRSITIQKG